MSILKILICLPTLRRYDVKILQQWFDKRSVQREIAKSHQAENQDKYPIKLKYSDLDGCFEFKWMGFFGDCLGGLRPHSVDYAFNEVVKKWIRKTYDNSEAKKDDFDEPYVAFQPALDDDHDDHQRG